MVIGDGKSAQMVRQHLLSQGTHLICVERDSNDSAEPGSSRTVARDATKIETISSAQVTACQGTVGDFRITIRTPSTQLERCVDQVVIAEEALRRPQFSAYQLAPVKEQILALSDLQAAIENPERPERKDKWPGKELLTVFLVGLMHDNHPVIFKETMQLALKLRQTYRHTVYIMTGNLKVADEGLEALYQQTRQQGIRWVKFTHTLPTLEQQDDSSCTIRFEDEIAQQTFELNPQLVVVDETIIPSGYLPDLIRIFNLERDASGFAQADNVYRLTTDTNRKGIQVVGPSRVLQSPDADRHDVADSALSVLNLKHALSMTPEDRATIDSRYCIRCLTCYRICPYRAVALEKRVRVAPAACEKCGICVVECPRGAISLNGANPAEITALLETAPPLQPGKADEPIIVVLGCGRSAMHAGFTAQCLGVSFPPGLHRLEVACAGSISSRMVLEILRQFADGILVVGCHPDNCHSAQGTLLAQERVNQLRQRLPDLGIDAQRLQYHTIAANMAGEFARLVETFRDQIQTLTPNLLIRSQTAQKGKSHDTTS